MLKFVSSRENLFSIGLKQLLTPSKDISIENLKFSDPMTYLLHRLETAANLKEGIK